MDTREEVAGLLKTAQVATGAERLEALLVAVHRHLGVIDDEIVKLRKELRTRNGDQNVN